MFVAMRRFVIANDRVTAVREAFRQRPRSVDQAAGFIRMEVLSPVDCPEEMWLMTYWQDKASYERWHAGPDYRNAQQHIPKGLKLHPGHTELRFFDVIAE